MVPPPAPPSKYQLQQDEESAKQCVSQQTQQFECQFSPPPQTLVSGHDLRLSQQTAEPLRISRELSTSMEAQDVLEDGSRSLWIDDLLCWMDEQFLYSCFASKGEVVAVKIIRNKRTGESEGYGFIEFVSHAAAQRNLRMYNGTLLPNVEQTFRMNLASAGACEKHDGSPEYSIFVEDSVTDITDFMLRGTFPANYPSVKGAKITQDWAARSTKCRRVRFGDEYKQMHCMYEMNEKSCSRPMQNGTSHIQKKDAQTKGLKHALENYNLLSEEDFHGSVEVNEAMFGSIPGPQSLYKRRRISADGVTTFFSFQVPEQIKDLLPKVSFPDYYTKPSINEMAIRELDSPGYCSGIVDFTVGRVGYGCVKFFGETDVRHLDLDSIIKFNRHEVVVYEDETSKPVVGKGLNKKSEVTLLLQLKLLNPCTEDSIRNIVKTIKHKSESQGAQFLSFDPFTGEWKFIVQHFSRFGLGEDEDEDIVMNDISPEVKDPVEMIDNDISDIDEETILEETALLSHSLPAHLGLDPVRMKEMRMLMFPAEDNETDDFRGRFSHDSSSVAKETPDTLHHSYSETANKMSLQLFRRTPLALIEYNPGSFSSNCTESIVMAGQNKGLQLKTSTSEGFMLDLEHHKTPVAGIHSHNIVDAALFMGRSFRVGWGPNGVLVHSGIPVCNSGSQCILSSVINLEKVALDKVIRDENDKVKEELIELCFDSPLRLHKELNHEIKRVQLGNLQLKLQKVICDRLTLPEVCRNYIEIIEKQLEVPSLASDSRVLFMHQVMVWELVNVLFSSKKTSAQSKHVNDDDEEDMIPNGKETYLEVDPEALPLMRRAEFSYWLQESVYHRVQEEVSSIDNSNELEHIFLLLTGRQLDAAVELAASRGDVRLSCLLSLAGGSNMNRSDISHQLDIWRKNGMDFNFFEDDRIKLLELLSGNIHGALHGVKIDWKRFLGLVMWYQLPPDVSLPVVFNTYQKLINAGNAPYPVPVYIDEGSEEDARDWHMGEHFDLAYYLMLLHARQESDFGALKRMFSAFASTNDPLDYHMIWHQRAVLEAIGTFSSNDLHILDMGFVAQLVCSGLCHWAIYVVLHMTYREDYPYLQTNLIREILFQYCEVWSTQDSQWKFIENLGIPSSWLHEALAIYFSYNGDLMKALHHFLECNHWQRAHSIFLTSVAHSLFLSGKHSEIWRIATSMEDHKSEIEDWDLGAGIYISFYLLRSSFEEENNTMTRLDTLENKNDACADFIGCLNKSLAVSGSTLSLDASVAYSKMAEEICSLLLSVTGQGSTSVVQLSCFNTAFTGPIPEDLRASHLQDAVSLFTSCLLEMAQ